MRSRVRVLLAAPLIGAILALLAVSAPAAQAVPAFGVEKFSAANCTATHEGCAGEEAEPIPGYVYWVPKETTVAEEKIQGYTQAAGHPAWGITDFKVNTVGELPNEAPVGVTEKKVVAHVRTDVGPGVSTNPEAMPECNMKEFDASAKEEEAIPGTGFYPKPKCSEAGSTSTVIGVNYVTVYAGPGGVSKSPEISDLPLKGTAYNVVPPEGRASDFGVALELPIELTGSKLKKGFEEAEAAGAKPGVGGFPSLPEQKFVEEQQYYAHTMIEGSVEWAGNYHDYYEINISTALPLISSRLVLKGNIGSTEKGGYITLPSNCPGPGPATTNTVTLTSTLGQLTPRTYITPLGAEGCNGESPFSKVPFEPAFKLSPETTQSDQPDGITTELTCPARSQPDRNRHLAAQNRHRHTARRHDAQPLGRGRSHGSLHARSGADPQLDLRSLLPGRVEGRHGHDRSPDASAGVADREPVSRRSRSGSNHGASVHDVPQRRIEAGTASPCACRARSRPTKSTGQLTATFTENPEQPFSNAILQVHRRRARADRQPAHVRHGDDRHRASSRTSARSRRPRRPAPSPLTATAPGDLRLPAAVRAQPERRQPAPGQRRREDLIHAQHRAQRRPAVPLAGQDRRCPRVSSACSRR